MTGFRSYKLLYYNNLLSLDTIEDGLLNIVNSRIKDGEVYVVLIEIGYGNTFYCISKALYLSDEESVLKALAAVQNTLELIKIKYNLEGELHLAIKGRVFLDKEEYIELKDSRFRKELMKKLDKIQKEFNQSIKTTGNNVKTLFDKVVKLSKAVSVKYSDVNMLYLHNSLYSLMENLDYITCQDFVEDSISDNSYVKSTKVSVDKNNTKYDFVDRHYTDGTIKRTYLGNTYVFKDNTLVDIIFTYNCSKLRKPLKDSNGPSQIGAINIITYADCDNKLVPYAAGFKVGANLHTFYHNEGDNFNDVVLRMIKFINSNYPGCTFYVHMLDRYGIYLLNGITANCDNLEKLTVLMNENAIYKINTPTIKILDSNKLLHATLDKVLVDFQTSFSITDFIEDLVNEQNIHFKGYLNSSNKSLSANQINPSYTEFDMEMYTISYLVNTLKGLDTAINKFSTIIYDKYSLDITKCTTISSLAYKIFLTNFYKSKENIKVIGGIVDMDIRNAHYGGVTAINKNHATNVFYYDMNSQYPSAMRNPMPVGNPILSTNIDLDNSFGYFYAHILVPHNQMSLVPYRTELGVIEYPSTDFSGWYFSEELKALKLLNYQIKLEGGYLFESSSTVFTSFVEKLYNDQITAKKNNNITLANILKLIMNSLYGKTGMNPITTFSKIIRTDDIKAFDIQYTIIKHIPLPNGYSLVVAHNKANQDLLEMLNKTEQTKPKTTGNYSQSSVPLAAAIAAYARVSMFPFKTLSQNDWIYSDTDSIILEKELGSHWVSSDELGKMKLEHKVLEVFCLGPKFYAMLVEGPNNTRSVVIKCSGVNSQDIDLTTFQELIQGIQKKVKATVYLKKFEDHNALFEIKRDINLQFNPKYNKLHIHNNNNNNNDSDSLIYKGTSPFLPI